MDFLLGVSVAVSGWLVSHFLALRAQRENFHNQLLDRARMEIGRALGRYQDWLSLIYTTLIWVNTTATLEAGGIPPAWDAIRARVTELFADHRAGSEWSISLEEYEALYPETAGVRRTLLERERRVLEILSTLSSDLMAATFPGTPIDRRRKLATWAQSQQQYLVDQEALISDLRVHLQNASLRRITGVAVSLRTPADPTVPVMVHDVDGTLIIVPAAEAGRQRITTVAN